MRLPGCGTPSHAARTIRPQITVTIVTVEEQMRGWLAEISRHRDLQRQIIPYAKLQRQVEAFADWTILPWDREAAEQFVNFRRQGVCIGTMDLKIACLVRVQGFSFVSFKKHFENK